MAASSFQSCKSLYSFPPCHYQLHPLLSSPQADKELSPCNVIMDGFHKTTQPEPKKIGKEKQAR